MPRAGDGQERAGKHPQSCVNQQVIDVWRHRTSILLRHQPALIWGVSHQNPLAEVIMYGFRVEDHRKPCKNTRLSEPEFRGRPVSIGSPKLSRVRK